VGFVVAVALLNLSCLAAVGGFAYRRGGSIWAAVALVLLAFLFGAMGRDVVTSIWNPYFAIAPLAVVFVTAWSAASGDSLAVPFLVAAASLVIQAHVVFVPIVACLVLAASVGFVVCFRAGRVPTRVRRHLLVGGIVLVVCWALPLAEQVTHQPGNISELWRGGTGSDEPSFGWAYATRFTARAVSIPPWWIRRHAEFSDYAAVGRPLAVGDVVLVILFVVALIALTAWSWRRLPVVRNALLMAAVGLVASVFTVARLPVGFAAPLPYRSTMVRLAGWYAWFAVLLAAGSALRAWWGVRSLPRPARPVAALGVAVVLVCAVSSGLRRSAPDLRFANNGPAIASLSAAARSKIGNGPYRFEERGPTPLDSSGPGIMWDLARHGVDVRVDAENRYIGKSHPARAEMPKVVMQTDPDHALPDPGMVEVARYRKTSETDAREARRLRRVVLGLLLRNGLPAVSRAGRRNGAEEPQTALGRAVNDYTTAALTPEQLIDGDTLWWLVFARFVDVDDAYVEPFSEYHDLEQRIRQGTCALYADRAALRSSR
jgi:hypothetical protein